MKILYVASEARPFIASGGLADVAGALPKALKKQGASCRVVIPLYGGIKEEFREKMKFLSSFLVNVSWRRQYCGVFELNYNGVIYYFIDNEYYFKRNELYGFYDDAERFAFFSRAVLEMLNFIDFEPDVIHTNDWQTSLVPTFLNCYYRHIDKFRNIRTVFTIHNIQYQGKYGMDIVEDVFGVAKQFGHILEYQKCSNLMKGAIEMSDKVTTVSPTYAREILDPWFSHSLDSFLQQRQYKLCGILNGIDVDVNNPETDPNIYANYTAKDLKNKETNKKMLLERVGLPHYPDVPVIGIVTRLVSHKGMDLVKYALDDIVKAGIQVVVLGSGETVYENFFFEKQYQYPKAVAFVKGFIPELANKIYAGADMFLMPSKSEPCGLAQMVAARYGTLPIVRETGGLADSIQDMGGENGNGFTFKTYNAHDMLGAIMRAKGAFDNREDWTGMVKQAMASDFSWDRSALEYIDMYNSIL